MRLLIAFTGLSFACAAAACSDPGVPPLGPTGGASSGGASSGGGGAPLATGGVGPATGGVSSGGVGSGGLGSGGLGSGGLGSGGLGSGGVASGGASAGGSGSGGAPGLNCNDPVNLPRTYAAVRECIIEAGCQSSICHGGEVPLLLIDTWENFPRREDHSPYDKLTDTLLNYTVEQCSNSPLVDPGNPQNSAIVKALGRQCDDPDWGMPDGCLETPCIPQTYIDFIAEWIEAGALM